MDDRCAGRSRSHMKKLRSSFALIAFSVFLISCGSPDQQGQGLPSTALVRVNAASQLVTLDVKNAPLGDILTAIGQQAQLTISPSDPITSERLSLSFQGMPLEDALKRVLAGQSYTFTYKQDQGREVLAGVRLFANSGVAPFPVAASSPKTSVGPVVGSQTLPMPVARSWGRGESQINKEGAAPISDAVPLDDLKRSLSEAQDPARRSAILDAMANRGEEGPVAPALSTALSDSDEEVRTNALDLLRSSSEPVPLGPLAKMAATDNKPDLRMDAMTLMAEQLYAEERPKEEWAAVQASLNRSLSDPSLDVREHAEMLLSDLTRFSQPTSKRAFR